MKNKQIYLVYSHEYKVGYVGQSCNLKRRYRTHCGDNISCVKQFCKNLNIHARDTFDIDEIMKCNAVDASYYEGHVYDLIEQPLPDMTLINKNKPNRSEHESWTHWWKNNLERHITRCRQKARQWYADNREHKNAYQQLWAAQHPNYSKEYYAKNKKLIK